MANDFRGYLKTADKYALDYTGNDGRIDWNKVNSRGADTAVASWDVGQADKVQNYVSKLYSQYLGSKKPSGGGNGDLVSSLSRELASLRNSMPPTPKLANFDVMANWRTAQKAAEKAVNPLYKKKLDQFLSKQKAKKTQKKTEFNLQLGDIETARSNTLEDNTVNRARTSEDVAGAIEDINTKEGQFQTDEGESFDQNYRAAAEQLAASGMAGTGIGGQQTSDAIRLRNVQSQRQLDEFQGNREAKQLFKTRTFEDLARGDVRAENLATSQKKAAQFDLDAYLEDLDHDQKAFRLENEQQRLSAVYDEAGRRDQLGVEKFLASLAKGGGYSAQDVAYNRQVYA